MPSLPYWSSNLMARTALCVSVTLSGLSALWTGSFLGGEVNGALEDVGERKPFRRAQGALLPLLEVVRESSGRDDDDSGEVVDSEFDRKPLPCMSWGP